MRVTDGMGSYLVITRDHSYVLISARVGMVPLLIQYVIILAIIGWKLWRKKCIIS